MGTRHHAVVDLTGGDALAPGEIRTIDNPVKRIPNVIFVDLRSGDTRLDIDPSAITPLTITVENPSLVTPNESVLLVEHWHTRTA